LKVAYLGLTCEAPIFVALEKGFYKEEGLDVELVKTDWSGLSAGLSSGNFDANHTLIMFLLQAMEAGADVRMTGGIHTGCLWLQTAAGSNVKKARDLKGKKIGVPTQIGSPPYLFASRVLVASGVDPRPEKKEVEWLPLPPEELGAAVSDGRVDAVCAADPIGTILLGKGITRTIADQSVDLPYSDEYCCAAVVSGKLARENPRAAAGVTRAFLKAARWVHENPTASARLGVDKRYVAASVDVNAQALAKLKYDAGVAECRKSILSAAQEMKQAGLLKTTTDPMELTIAAWLDLEGVTDSWVKGLRMDKIADGGRPTLLSPGQFVALFEANGDCTCCCRCCIDR
jgi:NitT/TauT family transport system substrate-binding protein